MIWRHQSLDVDHVEEEVEEEEPHDIVFLLRHEKETKFSEVKLQFDLRKFGFLFVLVDPEIHDGFIGLRSQADVIKKLRHGVLVQS